MCELTVMIWQMCVFLRFPTLGVKYFVFICKTGRKICFLINKAFSAQYGFSASVERTTASVKVLKRDLVFPNIKHPKRPIHQNIIKKIESKSQMPANICQIALVKMESTQDVETSSDSYNPASDAWQIRLSQMIRQFWDFGKYVSVLRWMVGEKSRTPSPWTSGRKIHQSAGTSPSFVLTGCCRNSNGT